VSGQDAAAAAAIAAFLRALGLPEDDPELKETPARVAAMFRQELLDGYSRSPAEILRETFPAQGANLVALSQIDFQSVCPHHLVPVIGVAQVAYLPVGKVAGFSQIIELIDALSHRLVLQEQLGAQITAALVEHLETPFAACSLTAQQLCMIVRGSKRPQAKVTTYAFAGARAGDPMLKELFLRSAGGR
jgi:GTP cyclohydrolase IA